MKPRSLCLACLCLAAIAGALQAQNAQREPSEPEEAAPPPGREQINEGWQAIRFADFLSARRLMKSALDKGDSNIQAEATYALGYINQYDPARTDADQAAELYTEVVNSYPDSPSAPWAHLALARMADLPPLEKNRNEDQARRIYRQVIARHPKHMVADEATLRLAYTYMEKIGQEPSWRQGIELLEKWLKDRPDNFLAPAMHLAIAQPLLTARKWDQAIEALIQADEADARGERIYGTRTLSRTVRSNLYWQIGRIAEEHLDKPQLARKYYLKIVEEIGRDSKAYVAARRARRLESRTGGQNP